jgi:hypothetical protein
MSSDAAQPNGDGRSRKRFDLAHSWTSTVAGLVALALSVYNFIVLEQEPEVDVAFPHIVRVAQGGDTWVYLQPTLSARLDTEEVEVITEAKLDVRPDGKGATASFFWDESGAFSYDASAKVLTYQRNADPGPLVVSQTMPQQPVMLFSAIGWNFTAGRYEGTLTLKRASRRTPLTRRFCLVVSKEAVSLFRKTGENTFQSFRNDLPARGASTAESSKDCHVLSAF